MWGYNMYKVSGHTSMKYQNLIKGLFNLNIFTNVDSTFRSEEHIPIEARAHGTSIKTKTSRKDNRQDARLWLPGSPLPLGWCYTCHNVFWQLRQVRNTHTSHTRGHFMGLKAAGISPAAMLLFWSALIIYALTTVMGDTANLETTCMDVSSWRICAWSYSLWQEH